MTTDCNRTNDLLRGRELTLGLEVPIINRDEIAGREEELKLLWASVSQEERDHLNETCERIDKEMALMNKAIAENPGRPVTLIGEEVFIGKPKG